MQRYEVKFAAEDVTQTGEFSGYGAVFGNVDEGGDVIEAGAFSETLKQWKKSGKLPPMLLQHDLWGMNGSDGLPVGKWLSMEEDGTGLFVKGRLINLETDLGKRIYGALKEGVLDGMSIGYRVKRYTPGTKPKEPRRKLHELDLVELSLVTFPMNGKARVQSVKSLGDLDATDYRDIEASLRDAGLSRADAVKAVAGLKSWARRDAEPPETGPCDKGLSELADLIRKNIAILS